ncbi:hypothetical protein NRIC_34100 [Enterococcus florum]|uniref:Uncharacterized protein n=1 Tax=Enterococcus florum TaxID=2480627 RepID=A0A4V0WPY9_9ENTE|nr:hypothetical protein [Enterococcus florum]GCF95519.1 hypothetical protein NRIC_34100 [Enterococcus florum]
MPKSKQIDTLKEQISFLEARITRYEELRDGTTFRRILFGGGRHGLLSVSGFLIGAFIFIYAITRGQFNLILGVLSLLSLGVLAYCFIQLNLMRKKNPPEKYERMVKSLKQEKRSMDTELLRMIDEQNKMKKQ